MSGSVAAGRGRASPEGAIAAIRRGPSPARSAHSAALGGVLPVPGGGLAARLQHQLVEDVGDVALDGVRAEVEGAGDQLVAVAGGDVAQHLELARAERHRRGGRRREAALAPLPPASPGGRAGAAARRREQRRPGAQGRAIAAAGSRPCQSASASARRFVAPSISAPAPGWPSRSGAATACSTARPRRRRARGRAARSASRSRTSVAWP